MPYKTTWEKNGIYWKYSGVITREDIFKSNEEFYGDLRSDNVNYQIIDTTDTEEIGFDDSAMEEIGSTGITW